MADRKVSELNAADSGNLHDAALVQVVDLTEAAAADQNVKATIAQLRATILEDDAVDTDVLADGAVAPAKTSFVSQLDAAGAIYVGRVLSAGTAGSPFPSGWTSGLDSGVYTITHNFASTDYVVLLTAEKSGLDTTAVLRQRATNEFYVETYVEGTGNFASGFYFMVVRVS